MLAALPFYIIYNKIESMVGGDIYEGFYYYTKNFKKGRLIMNKWYKIADKNPDFNEPVLCFLDNGQQIILAIDEESHNWLTYDEEILLDAYVIAWKELETKDAIERQLVQS